MEINMEIQKIIILMLTSKNYKRKFIFLLVCRK